MEIPSRVMGPYRMFKGRDGQTMACMYMQPATFLCKAVSEYSHTHFFYIPSIAAFVLQQQS